MYRSPLLVLLLIAFCAAPVGVAQAQTTGKDAPQPKVVEPKAGEAVPPATTTPAPAVATPGGTTGATGPTGPAGTTGPDTPVTSGQATPDAGPGPGQPGSATTGPQGLHESSGSKGGSDDTWLAISAAVLAGLLIAWLITAALWRWRGWDPRWRKRWRHATAEASWRLSLSWAEFRDFMRLGR